VADWVAISSLATPGGILALGCDAGGNARGGQRVVTRLLLSRRKDGLWMASAGRHWNIDPDDPR
jgi:hypothetical protein